jgi:hypothetical protein
MDEMNLGRNIKVVVRAGSGILVAVLTGYLGSFLAEQLMDPTRQPNFGSCIHILRLIPAKTGRSMPEDTTLDMHMCCGYGRSASGVSHQSQHCL